MPSKQIVWFGKAVTLACDGLCCKAWGIASRPKVQLGEDADDVEWLADGELGDAPADPGSYEGGHGKPDSPARMNKWCSRACERSYLVDSGVPVAPHDWTRRVQNQPWKHATPTPHHASGDAPASNLLGISVVVLPDSDEAFRDIPEGSAGVRGGKLYVRESLWPTLKAALEKHTASKRGDAPARRGESETP